MDKDVNQEIIEFLNMTSGKIWEYFHQELKPYDPNLSFALGKISAICDMASNQYKHRKEEIND